MYKIALIGAIALSGCVAATPQVGDADQVRISVEASGKTSYERILAAAQPLADRTCAAKQKSARMMVTNTVTPTHTRLAFLCE